jgi:7-carboxy-7-deazaguanine synthase
MTSNYIITEIFASIQGESSYAGKPCTFIRLSGCPLRCSWCDTAYGFADGDTKSLESILDEVNSLTPKMVELTGGEPLAQEGLVLLAEELLSQGYRVLIETGGSESIEKLPQNIHIVMDLKCPGSKMEDRNLWSNLDHLKPTDEIKFVVADRNDFDWAQAVIEKYQLCSKHSVLFSPAWGHVKPDDLSAWLIESGLDCRLNLQLHKYIWGPRVKGV